MISEKLDRRLEFFKRTASRELFDAGYHSFYFDIKVKDNNLLAYLIYDMDPEDSDMILSWHIHLQELANKLVSDYLEGFNNILVIVEAKDLWSDLSVEQIEEDEVD
jgi:hypothetical protein